MPNKNIRTESAKPARQRTDVLTSQPYSPTSYRLITKESIKIYNPNVISIKKRIISA